MELIKQSRIVNVPLDQLTAFKLTSRNNTLVGAENGVLKLQVQNRTNQTLIIGEGYAVAANTISIDLLAGETPGASEFEFPIIFPTTPEASGSITIIYTTYKGNCQ